MADDKKATFEGWCILDLLGHKRLAGMVSEATVAGATMLRVDVPESPGKSAATVYVGGAAVYSLAPTSEEIARAVAASNDPAPVQRWELPKLLGVAAQGEGAAPHDDDAVDLGARIPNLDDDSGFTLNDHGEKDDRPF